MVDHDRDSPPRAGVLGRPTLVLSAHASLHGAYLSHCDNGEFGEVVVGRCNQNGGEREEKKRV